MDQQNVSEKVTGYKPQTEEAIALVNEFKAHEKALGELWKKAQASGLADQRMLALGKSHAQTGYMWMNRAIFKPVDFFE